MIKGSVKKRCKMSDQVKQVIDSISEYCSRVSELEVLWLYGSRAKGTEQVNSDYDLAVALTADHIGDYIWLDDLAYRLRQLTGVEISIVDINKAPVPLTVNIINDGKVLFCRDNLRMHREMQRAWSMWEHFKYQYEHNRL